MNTLPVPSGLSYLPYQETGVRFLVDKKRALLADEMGLGKTIQAIGAINALTAAKTVLVVCPASLKLNWQRELLTWLCQSRTVQIVNGRNCHLRNSDIIIVNYDLLIYPVIAKQLSERKFDVGIFDESHYLKGRKTKRTKAVLLKGGVASRCSRVWFMTGTPVLNRPVELFPVLRAAAPEVIAPYTTFAQYAYRYCAGWYDQATGIMWADGATNVDELNERLQTFMLRRRKEEVLKDLPEKRFQIVPLSATAKAKKLIAKEMTWGIRDASYQTMPGDVGDIARHRHELALSKLDDCIEYIKDLMEDTEKLVIFAHHRDVIKKLEKDLAYYNPMSLTGDTPQQARQEAVDEFQYDPLVRIFIGQVQAAGVGITLTAASTVVFVESSWVPGEIHQAVDRCHRIGQKNSVLAQFLVVEDSLEEHMLRTVIDKTRTIKRIVEKQEKPEAQAVLDFQD